MSEIIAFVIEVILPVATVIAFISRLGKVKDTETRMYAMIGILASKGVLDMQDLAKLELFDPPADFMDTLSDFVGKVGV